MSAIQQDIIHQNTAKYNLFTDAASVGRSPLALHVALPVAGIGWASGVVDDSQSSPSPSPHQAGLDRPSVSQGAEAGKKRTTFRFVDGKMVEARMGSGSSSGLRLFLSWGWSSVRSRRARRQWRRAAGGRQGAAAARVCCIARRAHMFAAG